MGAVGRLQGSQLGRWPDQPLGARQEEGLAQDRRTTAGAAAGALASGVKPDVDGFFLLRSQLLCRRPWSIAKVLRYGSAFDLLFVHGVGFMVDMLCNSFAALRSM